MSENATSRLTAARSKQLLALFREYLESDKLILQSTGSGQALCGLPVHLDGEALIKGFLAQVQASNLEPGSALEQFNHLLEIASYVRAGGIKSCLYRLETGSPNQTPDFFDTISEKLRFKFNNGQLQKTGSETPSLFQQLNSISSEDEQITSDLRAELDAALLLIVQKLEALSLADADIDFGQEDSK